MSAVAFFTLDAIQLLAAFCMVYDEEDVPLCRPHFRPHSELALCPLEYDFLYIDQCNI